MLALPLRLLRIGLLFSLMIAGSLRAEMVTLPLSDLGAFRPQAGNWQVVGSVTMDRRVSVAAGEASDVSQAVRFEPGEGVLLNLNTAEQADALLTRMEHGDLELSFQFMLPKGSNSGLYLQGRYEVQLFDSWGVKQPRFSDLGGIYRNWESDPEKVFRGIAPLNNAAKAPGLWQTARLLFRAPRFDEQGRKAANARMDYVEINGQRVHENIELPLPTGGPISKEESALGPLMIQGDHGPVAIRRIRYRLLEEAPLALDNLRFEAYFGVFERVEDFADAEPDLEGSLSEIDARAAAQRDAFALVFRGELEVGRADDYTFRLDHIGGVQLKIDGRAVIESQNATQNATHEATIRLQPGARSLELSLFKNINWWDPQLGLSARGSSTHWKPLHAEESYPQRRGVVPPIYADVGSEPRLHRGFFRAFGEMLPKAIAAGDPAGAHYVFDLEGARLVTAWRGDFVDATPMWHDRGNGTFTPRGVEARTFAGPMLATLSDPAAAFPAALEPGSLRPRGYRIDESTGRPVYLFTYRGADLAFRYEPDSSGAYLIAEVAGEGAPPTQPIWLKLAEGSRIEREADGSFAVDDRRYYVEPLSGSAPRIVDIDGRQELRARFDGAPIRYAFIW